jgi:signal transduction histidine kinase/CheY-like chemotaxis protein
MPSDIAADTNPQASGSPLLAAGVVLLLGLALSALGTRALALDRAERERLHLAQQAATQVRQLELALQLALESLTSVKAFHDAGGALDERQFERFVRSDAAFHEGTLALGWAPRIGEAERPAFEAALHERSGRPQAIFEATGHGLRRVVARCGDCYAAQYLTALQGGDVTPGLNLPSLPSRSQAIAHALASGRVAASKARRSDAWGADGDTVIQVFQPVWPDGVPAPGQQVAGLAFGVFNVSTLLRRVFPPGQADTADVALFDLDAPSVEQRLFTRRAAPAADEDGEGASDYASARESAPGAYVHEFRVADRRWVGMFSPAEGSAWMPWLLPLAALLGGVLLTGLLAVYLFAALARGQQVARLGGRLVAQQVAVALEREQRRQAQATASARSAFLQAASHDLRQPLHALGLSLGLLAAQPAVARDGTFTTRLQQSVAALHAMFDALLDLGRLESGHLQPALRNFDVAPLLQRLGEEAALQAGRSGLRLVVRVSPGLSVVSDPLLVERIVRNLLANALRYTAHGWVALRAVRRAGEVEIQVLDTGPGIARPQRERIFEPYVRDAHHVDGVGLGLAIVRALAGSLGHGVRVASRPGRGSVFALQLPAAEGAEPDVAAPSAAPPAALAGRRLLLVEDEPEVLDTCARLLRAWGAEVDTARDLESATRLVDAAAQPGTGHDLLLVDEHLGRASGSAWLLALRARGSASPALLISADATPALRDAAEACGAPLLGKPLTPLKLRAAISAALCQSAGR